MISDKKPTGDGSAEEAWLNFIDHLLTEQKTFVPWCEKQSITNKTTRWFKSKMIKYSVKERNLT